MSIFFKMYQIILCAVVMAAPVGAQGLGAMFSPGELSASHTKLEGLKNCTKCHSILGGIGDSNCLKCHEKLTARIRAKKGFHAQVKKRCISCHSDHKGKSYEMVQFDKEEFDHGKTGYELKEKHKVACKKCHKDEEKTYLGLSEKCISCHEDIHENELGQSCLKCHSLEGWKQLVFEHNRDSAYSLLGKHKPVQCEKCHKESSYKVPNYTLCITCHLKDDKHKGKPGKECTKCHSEVGWKKLHTDHSKTAYPLIGKHKTVECRKCHINGALKIKKFTSCDSGLCHKDIHKMQFTPVPCKGCHTEKRWKPSTFFHESPSYSGYKLIGAHKKVECAKCHKGGVYKPVEYGTCDSSGCHADPHKAQFVGQSCSSCHVEKTWKPSTYSHESLSYDGYKLKGAHKNVECVKCHKNGLYKPIEYRTCDSSSCHIDPHKAQFVGQSCSSCHIEKEWKPSTFFHGARSYGGYKLTGAHEKVDCVKCHKAGLYKPVEYKTCDSSGCHKDIHEGRFEGACDTCHTTYNWKPKASSHEKTGFPLKGVHKQIECRDCHKSNT
ncbi:MAG: hypothetical protein ACE5FU_06410, partial [Nitrospinota bacterium]